MKKFVLFLMLLVSLTTAAPAVEDERKIGSLPGPAGAAEEERKPGPLVVYGDDFMFAIKEPEGWTADIENAPKLSAGVVLYRAAETFEKHEVLIAIRVAKKVDEKTADDLAHEMKEFRKLYPDVEFKELKTPHPSYKSHAKTFAIPKSRYDYVAFLNPGPVTPYLFSVTMYTMKKRADKRELKIYKDVIKSLEFIPQDAAAPAAPR
jgi:hypothetical protein